MAKKRLEEKNLKLDQYGYLRFIFHQPDLNTLVHIKEELEALFNKPVYLIRNRENMNSYLKKRIEKDARYV